MGDFVIHEWNGQKIHIREDRYVSATDMGKATGKKWKYFLESETTQEYLFALADKLNIFVDKTDVILVKTDITIGQESSAVQNQYLIESSKGTGGGTYFHPKLALRFAQWCSPEFAVEVDCWLDDMLMGKNFKTLPFQPSEHCFIYRPLENGKSKWEKMFFKPFYDQLYLLDNKENKEPYNQHPPYFAQYTIKYIYDEVILTAPKQIYEELKLIRDCDKSKGLKYLHQYLSPEGKKHLEGTISEITQLIRIVNALSFDISQKKAYLEKFLQQRRGQLILPIFDNEELAS